MRYLIDAQVAEGRFHSGEQLFDGFGADIHIALHAGELTPPVVYGLRKISGIWLAELLVRLVRIRANQALWVHTLCDHLHKRSLGHVGNHHKKRMSRFSTGRQVQLHTTKNHSLMLARRAPPEPSSSSLLIREERLVQDGRVLPWRAAEHLRAEIIDAMVLKRGANLQVHLSDRLAVCLYAMMGINHLITP